MPPTGDPGRSATWPTAASPSTSSAGASTSTTAPRAWPERPERAPHAMLQELLNRSDDYLWALLANGATLRILRDSSTLVGPSYVEFDLDAIFDGDLFSDFAVLYLLCHQSRFEPNDPDVGPISCWLERWRTHAVETGARALGALRIGVHDAIEALGTGLVAHPANAALRDDLDHGCRSAHRTSATGLLRLVYRILFCFVAEDRGLLLDPDIKPDVAARYHQWYSTSRLRRIAVRRAGDLHGDHWQALQLVLDSPGERGGLPRCSALVNLGEIFEPGPIRPGPATGAPQSGPAVAPSATSASPDPSRAAPAGWSTTATWAQRSWAASTKASSSTSPATTAPPAPSLSSPPQATTTEDRRLLHPHLAHRDASSTAPSTLSSTGRNARPIPRQPSCR